MVLGAPDEDYWTSSSATAVEFETLEQMPRDLEDLFSLLSVTRLSASSKKQRPKQIAAGRSRLAVRRASVDPAPLVDESILRDAGMHKRSSSWDNKRSEHSSPASPGAHDSQGSPGGYSTQGSPGGYSTQGSPSPTKSEAEFVVEIALEAAEQAAATAVQIALEQHALKRAARKSAKNRKKILTILEDQDLQPVIGSPAESMGSSTLSAQIAAAVVPASLGTTQEIDQMVALMAQQQAEVVQSATVDVAQASLGATQEIDQMVALMARQQAAAAAAAHSPTATLEKKIVQKEHNDLRAAEEELNKQNTAQIMYHQQAAELSRARQQAAEAEMKQLSAEDQLRKAKLRAEEQESNQLRQKLADQQLDVAKRDAAEQQLEALRQKAAEEKVKRKAAEEALLQLQQQASEAAAREEAAEQERERIMEQVKHKAAETDDRLRALEADKLRGQMNGPNDKVTEQAYNVQNTAPHSVQTIDPHGVPMTAPHSVPMTAQHGVPKTAQHSVPMTAPHTEQSTAPHSVSITAENDRQQQQTAASQINPTDGILDFEQTTPTQDERGTCAQCNKAVLATQQRVQCQKGYLHEQCLPAYKIARSKAPSTHISQSQPDTLCTPTAADGELEKQQSGLSSNYLSLDSNEITTPMANLALSPETQKCTTSPSNLKHTVKLFLRGLGKGVKIPYSLKLHRLVSKIADQCECPEDIGCPLEAVTLVVLRHDDPDAITCEPTEVGVYSGELLEWRVWEAGLLNGDIIHVTAPLAPDWHVCENAAAEVRTRSSCFSCPHVFIVICSFY